MSLEEIHEKLENQVADEIGLSYTGHGIHHAQRVYNLGMKLAEGENANKLVVGAACLLHDLHRSISRERGERVDPEDSIQKADKILEDVDFPEEKTEDVLYCVEVHEEYDFARETKEAGTLEAEIVQDADNLDAMGAIGIARCFAFGSQLKRPMWNPGVEDENQKFYDKKQPDESSIHHFYNKLLKLKENMNTETAKEIALDRHQYMEKFVERFKKEWEGYI